MSCNSVNRLRASYHPPPNRYVRIKHRRSRAVAPSASSFAPAFAPTPHAGYHWDGSSRRFFEGWYWKVKLSSSSSTTLNFPAP
jgi:hypothetical protein